MGLKEVINKKQQMKKIEEVRSDHTSDPGNVTSIDVWHVNNEQGHTVAIIIRDTDEVIYTDPEYIGNKLVQEEIDKVLWKELNKLRKVTLTLVVDSQAEAEILAREMIKSPLAGEGLFTLTCGDIQPLTSQDEEALAGQLPDDVYNPLIPLEHEKD